MKKLIVSTVMLFVLSFTVGVMAQDAKKSTEKEKTECCSKKKDKKEGCCSDKKDDKKSCCSDKKAEDKKAKDADKK